MYLQSLAARTSTLASRALIGRSKNATPVITMSRRSAQTTPSLGSEEAMKQEAIASIQARIAAQKEFAKNSGHKTIPEEVDEMWKWIKISLFVALPAVGLSYIKDFFVPHPHKKDIEVDYMKIRNKPFPWECEDCDLFDLDCWKACRAAKAQE